MDKPKFSILIPTTFGGLMHLAKLMPGLAKEAADNNAEIIIIDNNSRDGTLNYLANYDCTVKVNKINLGFAKAHNQAARIAQGDYLVLLNNDTVVYDGWLSKMVKPFEDHQEVGVVGCCIYLLDKQDKIQHAGVMFTPEYFPYELGLEIDSITPGITVNDSRVGSVREVPAVTAACMMISRTAWDKIGGFDEGYINGWEDIPLCLRAREEGYKIWYTGETFIKHKHFGSVNAGRFMHETANRAKYEADWVTTGRAKAILGDFING